VLSFFVVVGVGSLLVVVVVVVGETNAFFGGCFSKATTKRTSGGSELWEAKSIDDSTNRCIKSSFFSFVVWEQKRRAFVRCLDGETFSRAKARKDDVFLSLSQGVI